MGKRLLGRNPGGDHVARRTDALALHGQRSDLQFVHFVLLSSPVRGRWRPSVSLAASRVDRPFTWASRLHKSTLLLDRPCPGEATINRSGPPFLPLAVTAAKSETDRYDRRSSAAAR